MKNALLALAALAPMLGVALWAVWDGFARADIALSLHGWIALGLGVVLSLALAGGLMALVFISHRRGYDERAHWEDPDAPG
ncbi:MAG: hypothetical protein NW203_09840 [Hyphomonadaceae bacterium]|nr:hypothetical protein [Hyphomonadaceae bacterium]